jgi:aspartate aminotransferase
MVLKAEGFAIDAITPQAAIYLTLSFDLTGSTTADSVRLTTQPEVTKYILEEAGLAIVPFSAFGSSPDSTWYRLSVGTCDKKEIPNMLAKLRGALEMLVDNS